MSTPTKTLTLDVTENQERAIREGLHARIAKCQEYIDGLTETRSERTDLAQYWREQLDAARQALEIVQRGA